MPSTNHATSTLALKTLPTPNFEHCPPFYLPCCFPGSDLKIESNRHHQHHLYQTPAKEPNQPQTRTTRDSLESFYVQIPSDYHSLIIIGKLHFNHCQHCRQSIIIGQIHTCLGVHPWWSPLFIRLMWWLCDVALPWGSQSSGHNVGGIGATPLLKKLSLCSGRVTIYVHPSFYRVLKLKDLIDVGKIQCTRNGGSRCARSREPLAGWKNGLLGPILAGGWARCGDERREIPFLVSSQTKKPKVDVSR